MACLDENELSALAEGRLAGAALAEAEEHLDRCSACRALLGWAGGGGGPDAGAAEETNRDREPATGDRLGRYVLGERLGAGTMGVVYAAHDPELDRRVALKLIRPGGSGRWSEEVRARLLREARAMARVSHPEVISVYDVTAAGDRLVVAMELVVGTTVTGWLAKRARTAAEVLEVYLRAGAGLAAAHAAGVIHRDFKPDNVLVANDGRVKVTDFGLARLAGASVAQAVAERTSAGGPNLRLTRDGALLGSPAYMAPEQLAGREADARSDLFGFCVALYEGLYGERPFAGDRLELLAAQVASGAVRPEPRGRSVWPGVRAALLRGLGARPEDRQASMDALLRALRSAAAAPGRRPAARWIAGALVLAAAASLGAWLLPSPRAAPGGPERIALFPFTLGQIEASRGPAARGAGHDRLAARLPELILAGLGELGLERADPQALARALRDATEALGPDQAAALAKDQGAALFLTGDVVEVKGRLHVHAVVFESEAARAVAEATADGEAKAIASLAAGLARALRPALAERARQRRP